MENDEHFRRAFMFFDKDGSGYIESNELGEALADESGKTDNDVLNDIMHEVDIDKVSSPLPANKPTSLGFPLPFCCFSFY